MTDTTSKGMEAWREDGYIEFFQQIANGQGISLLS